MIIFRARADLIESIRRDLKRPHPFAAERVGFLLCRAGRLLNEGLIILAAGYSPVTDEDYIDDQSVGALMGPTAIRKAMQMAYNSGAEDISIFHVHMHEHSGFPGFSSIDISENQKFVPDFFNVAPMMPHGAIVLSHDRAIGQCWRSQGVRPVFFDCFASVGAPLHLWRKK